MKKKFFLLAIALGLWGLNANAQSATTEVASGNCGPTGNETAVTWRLTSDSVMTISGTGAMQDYSYLDDRPWHSHSTSIKTLVVNEGITALGVGTFMRFANLTSVTLPSTLTTIGTSAFNACTNLPEITIPDKVTSVGNNAFAGSKLTSITFPSTVTSIGDGALGNCASLRSVFVLSTTPPTLGSNTSLGSNPSTRVYVLNSRLADYQQAWSDLSATLVGIMASGDGKDGDWSWVIGSDSVLTISGTGKTSDYTSATGGIVPWYNHRLKVKTAVVETGITELGSHSFYNHANLTSVSLPGTLKLIGTYAFRNCSKLPAISLPANLETISAQVFNGSGVTSIHIPASVTTISTTAFYDAESLATLTVAASNTAYTAEGNVLYNKDKTTLHTWPAGIPYVEVYTLPETVTGIESNAFRNAKIGYLVLHDGMKTGSVPYGLSVCRHIQGVTLPSNATALMTSALQNAPLRSLTLPSSITSLSYSSLAYLAYLDHLISLPTTPPTAQSSTFTSTAKRVYVPSGSVSAYQAANYWKDFEITGIVANGTCGDGLTWILGADSTLIISGYGAMDNYSATSIPWLANRAGIKQVVVEDFVTSIGDYAFYNMPNLSSADLGERILTIGANAFANCSGLTEITIPASVAAIGADAFAQTGITAITALPTTPPSIEENTFAGVPADIDLTVPAESVEAYGRAMGWSAFGNHTSILGRGVCGLKAEWQLTDDGIMRVYGSGTMSNYSNNGMPWRDLRDQIRTLVVEEDISMIGYYAFQNCDSLTTVTLPSTLKRIGQYAFQDCDNLDLTLPDGITIIDMYAFLNCPKLTATLPSTLKELGTRAFQGTAVASAHIPAGLTTTMGDAPFADCQNLTAITVDANNPKYTAQDGVLYSKDMTQLRQYPAGKTDAEFKVPDGVTAILAYSFFGNAHLKAVSLPDGLKTINVGAFYMCSGLEAVNIPEGVTVLNGSVFYGCPSLRSVTLPSTLKNINANAFGGCSRIESIVSLAATPPTVGNSNVFYLVSKMVPVYVPSANVDDYKKANIWKDFKNIVGIQGSGTCGDGLTWALGADSVLVITGSGEMADYGASGVSAAPWNAQAAAIKAINLGAGVSKLGTYAFAGCTNVKAMYADATTPPAMTDANSVSGLPNGMPVYVPTGSVDAYKAADNWESMNIQGMIAHGKCGDNLTWTLTAAPDTTLTISGTGAMWHASEASTNFAPWYGYHNNIKSIVMNEGVANIGASVFRYCQNMTSLSLPSTLTRIDAYAFFMCRSIESITIPEGVTYIGSSAFSNCHSLKNLVLPSTWNNVSSDGAFAACYSLESFVLPNDTAAGDLRVIDGIVFSKDSTILRYYPAGRRGTYRVPDYVKTLYSNSFRAVSASRVEINDSVSLGSHVFYYCDSLRTVRLPHDLKVLLASTFCYANSLETLTIPAGVTEIGNHAIRCQGLRSLVMLPAAPPTTYQNTFYATPKDIPVYVHASSLAAYQAADYWDEFTNYVAYQAAGFCGYDLLWMVMPDSTLVLSGYGDMDDFTEAEPAPWSNMDISRVKIGANVTGIGQMAFAGCTRLAAIEVEEGNTAFVVKDSVLYTADGSTIVAYPAAKPQTKFETGAEVTTIASYAFAAATNLTELELTAGVSRIGEGAFSGCTNIASIVSRPTTPPTIADNTFSGVDKSIPVYVPENSLNDYKEAEHWKDFFENFQPIPGTGLAVVEQLEGVYVVNGRVMVYGYTGRISVFDVSGRCVLTTTDSSFELPQGVYLLRAGNAAAKVLVP